MFRSSIYCVPIFTNVVTACCTLCHIFVRIVFVMIFMYNTVKNVVDFSNQNAVYPGSQLSGHRIRHPREDVGSILGTFHSNTVSPTARYRYDASPELCCPGAKPRWARNSLHASA